MQREASDLVLAFLDELDEPRRSAFVLSELEQMTGAEAHAALGVNQNTLYYRLTSARKAFVLFLSERGILDEPTSGKKKS
jgi:DNA-directed RNA polymerase specialized sigma24 family protein